MTERESKEIRSHEAVERSWLYGSRPISRRIAQPLRSFLEVESSGGVLLLIATIVALIWANSPVKASYFELWHTHLEFGVGRWHLETSLVHVVNDGLMAVFFFVIGLEIKYEWVAGELRDRRAAILPIISAMGGMVVPAVLFIAIAGSTSGGHGWGVPMATDIAFAVGVMALLGSRFPGPLKVFLLTLAIVDDLGAIVVIALFYAGALDWAWLATAGVGLGIVAVLKAMRVRWIPLYAVIGMVVWFATWQSGVHATIAGVALAFLTPAIAFQPPEAAEAIVDTLENRGDLTADEVRGVSRVITESVSPLQRLEHALHPWSSYVIVPIFALANAGVELKFGGRGDGLRVAIAVMVGLVVGKPVGVAGAAWLTVRFGWARKPSGVSWGQLVGAGMLAGIGFTMSLFVADIAFTAATGSRDLVSNAKVGVLAASVVAATLGSIVMIVTARKSSNDDVVMDGQDS